MLIAHPEKSLGLLLDEKKNFPTIVRVWIYVLTRYGRKKIRGVEFRWIVTYRLRSSPWKKEESAQIILSQFFNSSNDRDSVVSVSIIFHRVVRFLDALSCTRVQLYGVLL